MLPRCEVWDRAAWGINSRLLQALRLQRPPYAHMNNRLIKASILLMEFAFAKVQYIVFEDSCRNHCLQSEYPGIINYSSTHGDLPPTSTTKSDKKYAFAIDNIIARGRDYSRKKKNIRSLVKFICQSSGKRSDGCRIPCTNKRNSKRLYKLYS